MRISRRGLHCQEKRTENRMAEKKSAKICSSYMRNTGIGNFFKNAANKVSSTIIKPIGNFVSHTIPDVAGKVLSAIKSGGAIDL